MKKADNICFTHSSDEYRETFTSKTNRRPTFYWFTDRYFDHLSGLKYSGYKYFYFFLKDPLAEKIAFRARHPGNDVNGLFEAQIEFHRWAQNKEKNIPNKNLYAEPAIMYSFSRTTPDLIGKYDKKKKDIFVCRPEKFKGTKLGFFYEDGFSKNFLETKLASMFPTMSEALPFADPEEKNGKYHFAGWIPMITETDGSWI